MDVSESFVCVNLKEINWQKKREHSFTLTDVVFQAKKYFLDKSKGRE